MPLDRRDEKGRKSTIAGLIAVSAATLLMMAWAIFPSAALADHSKGSSTAEAGTSTTTETTTTESSSTNDLFFVRDASSGCNEKGHVIITAYFQNNSDMSLTVTVTDITFAGHTATAVVPAGAAHNFFLDAGVGPLPGGLVSYHVEWDGGQADFTREHSPTKCPAQSTTTRSSTTSTTPGGSTTSSTTSATSTTETTSTTQSTASGTTVTPPSSSSTTPLGTTVSATTVSPGGTAFTGLDNVVPLGTIALVLMTSGAGMMWAGARRRRDDGEDEE